MTDHGSDSRLTEDFTPMDQKVLYVTLDRHSSNFFWFVPRQHAAMPVDALITAPPAATSATAYMTGCWGAHLGDDFKSMTKG